MPESDDMAQLMHCDAVRGTVATQRHFLRTSVHPTSNVRTATALAYTQTTLSTGWPQKFSPDSDSEKSSKVGQYLIKL